MRLNIIQKITRAIRFLIRGKPKDARMAIVEQSLLMDNIGVGRSDETHQYCVAVQGIHDPLFYGLFASLITDLRKRIDVSGHLLLVHSISYAIGTGWRESISRSLPYSWLVSSQWARANKRLVGPVGYRSHSIRHPIGDLIDWRHAGKLWRALGSAKDASVLSVDGILIGDLVIDSYLRFRPSPEFNVNDSFVRKIIWQALRDIRRASLFFKVAKPKLYLSSYSTYIEHGVAVRIALKYGVAVRVYGNPSSFGMKLSLTHFYHTIDTSEYKKDFSELTNRNVRLDEAEKMLNLRFSGGVDTATAYMKTSAYEISNETVPNVAGDVVIFLHDFYDSPHVYADLVFPDFWSWIIFTIEVLKEAKIGFWIKPHPNQISLSDLAYKELINRYANLRIISPRINNKQLAEAGMKCGVTVYGTVAHELAYMGVPSIACARHPHHSFDFCRTAHTKKQYRSFLLTPDVSNLSKKEMRDQSLAFVYMHNLNLSSSEQVFRTLYSNYFKVSEDQCAEINSLHEELALLRRQTVWQIHVDQLVEDFGRDISKKSCVA